MFYSSQFLDCRVCDGVRRDDVIRHNLEALELVADSVVFEEEENEICEGTKDGELQSKLDEATNQQLPLGWLIP
jgi:hypothetical protein